MRFSAMYDLGELLLHTAKQYIYINGAVYVLLNEDEVVWKVSHKFDIPDYTRGDKVDKHTDFYRDSFNNKSVVKVIPREVYGMRCKVTTLPLMDDDGINVVGYLLELIPVQHPIADAFDAFAPLVSNMIPGGSMLYMTDLTKIAYKSASATFDMPSISVGRLLKPTDIASKAIKMRQQVVELIPKEAYGEPILISNYPLYDDSNNVVATLGIAMPKTTSETLKDMSSEISESLNQLSQVITGIANSSVKINENEVDLNDSILNTIQSIQEINSLVDVIKSIANQTHMLGLNASIEAARAGDNGRGFSVVAAEIRKLADSTKESLPKINELTRTIDSKLTKIKQASSESIDETQEQSSALEEVSASIEQLTASTSRLSTIAKNV